MLKRIKGNIFIWIIVFIVAIVISNWDKIIDSLVDEEKKIDVSVVVDDTNIVNSLSKSSEPYETYSKDGTYAKATFFLNDKTKDLLISTNELSLDNYILVDNGFSPVVIIGDNYWVEECNFLFEEIPFSSGVNTYSTYSIDLNYILDAIESGNTWGDLGEVPSDIKNEPVSLIVPKLNTIEGKYVYSLIYETYKKEYPDIEKSELDKKVIAIYSKIKQSNSLIADLNDTENYNAKLWLMPEYMIANVSEKFSTSNLNHLIPIYPNVSISRGFYVYALNDENNLDIVSKWKSEILMNKLFIRVGNDDFYGRQKILNYFKKNINTTIIYDEKIGIPDT